MTRDGYVSAQRAVIGSLLIDPSCAGVVFAATRDEDFTGELRSLYHAARELFFSGAQIDPVVINDRLGGSYTQLLADLMRETPTAAHAAEYAEIVRRDAQLAQVQAEAIGMTSAAATLEDCREATSRISLILSDEGRDSGAIPLSEMVSAFFDRHGNGQKKTYLPWSYALLDKHLYTEPGDFIILGGYPSAGKSLMSIQISLAMARAGYRVGYFSLETDPKSKIADRVMSHAARVPLAKIKRDDLGEADIAGLTGAAEELHRLPIDFFPAGGYTLTDIQAKTLARRYQVIVIDYLQLIRAGGKDLREQVTEISKGLHTLAQRHGVMVLALSQLSRPGKEEGGKAKRPTMSSLRESGQLEQDADAVLLLYNETPDDRNGPRRLQIAKNKEGTIDSCLLDFDGSIQTLSDPKATWRDFHKKKRGAVNNEWRSEEEMKTEGYQTRFEDLGDGKDGDLPF